MYFFAVCKCNSAVILSIEIVNKTTNNRMWVQDILDFLGREKKEKEIGGHTHSSRDKSTSSHAMRFNHLDPPNMKLNY